MSNNFDYNEFAQSMSEQAMSMIPPDLTEDAGKYLVDTVKNFTYMTGEALVNDPNVSFTDDQYVLSTQIIAEWSFHKCVDLARSDVGKEYWDTIMQKIAFTVFEITKQGMLKNIPQEQLLQAVEFHVVKAYKESLKELCERGEISDSVFEKASELSNIDDMAEEQKKQDSESNENSAEVKDEKQNIKQKTKPKKVCKFSFFKKIFSKIKNCLASILEFIKTSLETILGFVVIVCNKKTLLKIAVMLAVYGAYKFYVLKIYEFINQIYNISSETLDIVVSIALGLGILTVIIKTFIQAIEADVQSQLGQLEEVRQQLQDLVNPDKMYERLGVDVLCLQVGAGLLCIADPDQEGDLLAKTAALRQMLTDELGYIIPEIRIMDSSAIDANEYVISVRGNKVASGFVYPDKYMVIADQWDSKEGDVPENAILGVDPTGEVQCYWLDKEDVEMYSDITAVTPSDVIKEHLKRVVIKYVNDILSTSDINKYIALIEKEVGFNANIAKEDVRKIFVNLIREKVSVKDLLLLFDRLNDYSRYTNNPIVLAERLRFDLKNQICINVSDENNVLYAVNLAPEIEKFLEANAQISETEGNPFLLIKPIQLQNLVETIAMCLFRSHQLIGKQPVILCSPKIRLPLYELLVNHIPNIKVIAYSELINDVKVEALETITFELDSTTEYETIFDNDFYEQEPLLGRVIDSDGKPLDGGIENYSLEEMFSEIVPADSSEPAPITKIFKTGVRAVDAFITIGCGQKIGVFAENGCGASTFLGLILKNSEADINIVSLVANTVENAWSFINDWVKSEPNIQRKTIVICSTPLDSAEKIKKNFETAISLCEYYRDKGKNVLFINDKTEPILNAAEKVARENGEPACENDYRLAVTSWYQSWINRCKNNDKGTITTILTVNTTSVDKNDKVVNIIRSATQGHVYVSRKVAEQNIYPAIDILWSISRCHINLVSEEQKAAASTIRKILSLYREGSKDEFVLRKYDEIVSFIQQRASEKTSLEETLYGLMQLAEGLK